MMRTALLALAILAPQTAARGAQDDAPNGAYAGYYTWPKILDRIAQLQKAHPDILHRASLGKTWEGRDIVLLKVSDHADKGEDEPEILIMAGIHPREQQPQICIMDLLDELVEKYGKDGRITKLVNERQIWIIPVFNVDGKVYDMKHGNGVDKGALWRKNRRPNADGAVGVDLNRNFPVRWGGGSDEPKSEVYEGPRPLSEPESQALAKFFDARPLRAFVDLHSSMKAILHAPYLIGPECDRFTRLARAMQELQKDPYRITQAERDLDPPPGRRLGNTGLTNAWGYYTHGVYSFIFEVAGNGFYPVPQDIHKEYQVNVRDPLLYLIEACGDLPLPRRGTATLREGKADGSLRPGAEVSWVPTVEGPCAFGVLVSEDPAVRVPSEYRSLPAKSGFTLQVAKGARPGHAVPMALYLWDRDRAASLARFTLTIAAP